MDLEPADNEPVRVVVLYAADDAASGKELVKRLEPHGARIHVWFLDAIVPGDTMAEVARQEVDRADVIVPLLSADFHANATCEKLLAQAMARHDTMALCLLPVRLRPAISPDRKLEDMQMLPREGAAILTRPARLRDEAWLEVVKEILACGEPGSLVRDCHKLPARRQRAPGNRWRRTHLWRELEKRAREELDAKDAAEALAREMPRVEALTEERITSELDFTLHDRRHAYRVAQRMADVIPADVLPELSAYELSLLLLSAYLHDIGLAPPLGHVSSHFQHLLTNEPCGLAKEEVERFLAWLDNDGRGFEPPLCKGPPTETDLRLARELVTHYCREQHEAWGELWIRTNLANERLGGYPQWIDDLVELCKSHRQGYHELVKPRFDPKQVGTPSRNVHLRYLAVVLRAADVLEFDPERTPDVIFRHRSVAAKPVIDWHEDQQISITHERGDKRLAVFAVPTDARVHRAVEIMLDEVDFQLRVCRRLADETHFDRCPGLATRLPHRWDLPPAVHREIRPKDGAYEYIDGSFRPDTSKVLALLGGTELYGNRYAAVRELIMNALDAVSEQIAYERLEEQTPADQELEAELGNRHRVTLSLEGHPEIGWTLVCSDTGAGMSKRILRDYLLVSGTSRRHDVLALERRCRGAGFAVGRIGQFGIGALSYFMLASYVTILTRRSQLAGEGEDTGWIFETEGVGSFGELRRHGHRRGTEVRLSLRDDVLRDAGSRDVRPVQAGWLAGLYEYLRATLRFVPCRVDFTGGHGLDPWSLRHGWTMDPEWIKDVIVDELRTSTDDLPARSNTPKDLLPSSVRKASEAAWLDHERRWSALRAEVRAALRLHEHRGRLPHGLGRYRIVIPYFELPGGRSMVFVRARQAGDEFILEQLEGDRRRMLLPLGVDTAHRYHGGSAGLLWESWKGFSVDRSRFLGPGIPPFRAGTLVQVDWASPLVGGVGVTRETMRHGPIAGEAFQWLRERATAELQHLCLEHKDSPFFELGAMYFEDGGRELPRWRPKRWFLSGRGTDGELARWGVQPYPCALPILYARSKSVEGAEMVLQGSRVAPIVQDWRIPRPLWGSEMVPPDRLVLLRNGPDHAALVWDRESSLQTRAVPTAAFPPAWKYLACIGHLGTRALGNSMTLVWNDDHPLVQVVARESLEWVSTVRGQPDSDGSWRSMVYDPRPHRDVLLQSRSRAAAWVIACLRFDTNEVWNGLVESDPSFLAEIWRLVFGNAARLKSGAWQPVIGFGLHFHRDDGLGLVSITPDGWASDEKAKGLEGVLPEPGEDWTAAWVVPGAETSTERFRDPSREAD
ncbi:TIR domain-containing protein [Sorangium sp. So ce291]|uniref:HD domain-containing protein n=1 Tax=Sorangium sp. So ce291 TaxID=3133294 RepID=UPI003F610445